MLDLDLDAFEALVTEVLDDLPDEMVDGLDNVVFLVEDEHPDEDLLGIYEGVAITDRGQYGFGELPDRIMVYRLPHLETAETLEELRGFPEPPPGATFDGPVLWIAGANSHYVLPQDRPRMDELFPATRLVRVKEAGHWVHSEQPEVFLRTVRWFLSQAVA